MPIIGGTVNEATEMQMDVLDALKALWHRNGMSPTVRDLMIEVGAANTNCIFTKLRSLQKKGLIEWSNGNRSRSIWPAGWREKIRRAIADIRRAEKVKK